MLKFFTMADEHCERVAALIHERVVGGEHAKQIGVLVTPDNLRQMSNLHFELAEINGTLVGYASWQTTWSTWRGLQGLYINDQFAIEDLRDVHKGLLDRCIARGMSEGARFVRTELDVTEEHVMEVYRQAGFTDFVRRSQTYLEAANFAAYVNRSKLKPL